jgi:hypothetical protein
MNRIQLLLIEQDYCLRYKNGMTITDRRKADCWEMGQRFGLHNQMGKATKKRVLLAIEELVWTMFANFADDYKPTVFAVEILGEDNIAGLRADAFREREAQGMPVPA